MVPEPYRETQWDLGSALDHLLRVAEIRIDKDFNTFCAEVEELLAVLLLLFFGQSIFGLGDLKFSASVQRHKTHAEVGPSWTLVRPAIGSIDTGRAYRGRVPDIRRSLDHLAIRKRRWGS